MNVPRLGQIGAMAPIVCSGLSQPFMTKAGAGVDPNDPNNWACAVPHSTEHTIGYAAFGGAALALFLLPGGWKLLSLPLAYVGLQYSLSGSGLI